MKTLTRRHMSLAALSLASAWLASASLAQAQALETVKIIVGFPAGTTPDVLARRVAEKLAPAYAKSVIVENRTGAGGQLAVSAVKAAPADGTTILLTPLATLGVYPHTYRSLPYNAETDLSPVSLGVKFDIALAVGTGVPAEVKNLPDFIQWAKANPARANIGSPAPGSPLHFAGAELSRLSKVEFQHIGYRGTVAAIPDLLGGQLPSMVSPLGEYLKYIPDGKILVLATSGSKRSGFTPQIGTFGEQGFKDLEVQEYYGFYLPAKSSPAQVQALNAAIRQAMSQPQVKEALDTFGMEAAPSSPEELATILRNYSKRWEPVVKAIGFKAVDSF